MSVIVVVMSGLWVMSMRGDDMIVRCKARATPMRQLRILSRGLVLVSWEVGVGSRQEG